MLTLRGKLKQVVGGFHGGKRYADVGCNLGGESGWSEYLEEKREEKEEGNMHGVS